MATWVDKLKGTVEWDEEVFILEATEFICERMKTCGIDSDELSRRVGITKRRLENRLNGDADFTLREMAVFLHFTGVDVSKVKIVHK